MRLVLGHLSSFGGQWFCPGDGIGCDVRVAQGKDKRSPFKVGDQGDLESRRYAVGRCVISLDNLGGPLFSPFPFPARVDMHVEASGTVASDSTGLADSLQFIVPQLGLARLPSHLVLSEGPVVAMRQEMIPRGWVEF